MSVQHLDCGQVWNMKEFADGAFGTLYQGTIKDWNGRIKSVAVKIMKGDKTNDSTSNREIDAMMSFNHPNIIKLLAVVTPDDYGHGHNGCYCDSQDKVDMSWIVMENLSRGNLLDFLRDRPEGLCAYDMIKIAYEVALGMDYLHTSANVMHRDLAARNILMRTDNSIKICDFGISRKDNPGKYFPEDETLVCPVGYAAPETMPFKVTRQTPIFTKKMDIWSFGVVLFEIWSRGECPFQDLDYNQTVSAVFRHGENVLCYSEAQIRPCIKDLMMECFYYNRNDRPDFYYIYQTIDGYL